MSTASKLQLKEGQTVRLVNAPGDVELRLPASDSPDADAVLVFVASREELTEHGAAALDQAREDRLAWIAYPKAGGLGTDLNRDVLWKLLEGEGVRPVRQVSLTPVWSALRFRPA